jgi:hypothetical protein
MKAIILLVSFLSFFVTKIHSQCRETKIVSPVTSKPTDATTVVSCSTFTAKWRGKPDQSFVFTTITREAEKNKLLNTNANTNYVFDGSYYTSTIAVKPGTVVSWTVTAISNTNGNVFYSYALRDGEEYKIPACPALKTPVSGIARVRLDVVSEETNSAIKIYPNPVESVLAIQFINNKEMKRKISIYDASGRLSITQTSSQSFTQINVSRLNSGVYFVKIVDEVGKMIYNGKVVVGRE